ncbi:MAG: DNA mismatch repair protein MutS, partial [Acidobacteriota bacterium]
MTSPTKLTPMLEQYFEIRRQAPEAILLYRLGDFYEMFFEDAVRAAPLLDLVLTSRGKGGDSEIPMCGVPYHAADQYVARLIRAGFSVAICDQIGDPSLTKGIVKREITRIITPGTATESLIIERDSCYLLSIHAGETVGAAYLDVSTGDFFAKSYESMADPRLQDDLSRFAPREVIFGRSAVEAVDRNPPFRSIPVTAVDDAWFDADRARQVLTRQFATQTLLGFGLEENDLRASAAGAALAYAASRHKKPMEHVRALRLDHDGQYLLLDAATLE